ncbi:MAG: periplasmic protein TorT [Rhodospirillaceae bacterium]|nr:periplasmic protein TorT [Rhodospirillaceae bacterium]
MRGTSFDLRTAGVAAFVAATALTFATSSKAADAWTYTVFEQQPPGFATENPARKQITYKPLEKASKNWHVCVAHPHLADPYHLAYNYGYSEEAKRLGVTLDVVEAGGYDHLPKQISQIEDCVARGANAVIISAISFTGLDNLVQELDSQKIPVIDLGNGISSPLVKAHSLGSYIDIGRGVGEYLAKLHPKGSGAAKVLWLPGPAGAGWAEDANKGFKAAVAGSAIEILDTKYGNSNKPEQLKLVEDGLQTFPDIDYIVGVAPAAEAGVDAIREAGRPKIRLIAYYQSPEVASLLDQGSLFAMASDSAVIQARIAMDQAVRVLEGTDYVKHVTPAVVIVDSSNSKSWDRQASLSPPGWTAVFHSSPAN